METGFYTEFRCGSREHSGLAWGVNFGKVTKYKGNALFSKTAHVQQIQKCQFLEEKKNAGGPAAETARSVSEDILSENLPPQNKFIFLIT